MKKLLVIAGPTGVGKSKVAIEFAKRNNGEIISADSMQVYKGMDIGTSKISLSEQKGIKHRLLDVVDIKKPFSAAKYQKLSRKAIEEVFRDEKLPIIVGGTGLYIRAAIDDLKFPEGKITDLERKKLEKELEEKGVEALFEELKQVDPKYADVIDKHNQRRIIRALEVFRITGKPFSAYRQNKASWKSVYPVLIVILDLPRSLLYKRIEKRVDEMIENGLLDETRKLVEQSFKNAIVSKQAIGYKEIIDYIDGKVALDTAIETIKKRTRNYAKRQITWFKKDPRAIWISAKDKNKAINEIKKLFYHC